MDRMKKIREDCGCEHDHRKWLKLCPTHQAEYDALHRQALEDHKTSSRELRRSETSE